MTTPLMFIPAATNYQVATTLPQYNVYAGQVGSRNGGVGGVKDVRGLTSAYRIRPSNVKAASQSNRIFVAPRANGTRG